jgi:hypothetical protein
VDSISIARDKDKWRVPMYAVMNLRVQNAGRLSSGSRTGGLSSSGQLLRIS